MTRQALLILTAAITLTACPKRAQTDDVLATGGKSTVIERTTQCTVPNADGVRCDKKTCKADQRSNCADFADRCRGADHTYEGNDEEGTCIREAQIG